MTSKPGRSGVLVAVAVLGAASLAACSKHSAAPQSGAASPQSAAASDLPAGFQAPAAARLQLLYGADQAGIRAYLQSVREVQPKKFEVQWSADTVAVSRDEALRSLHAVNDDGSEYTFASSEPVVSKLKKGAILWIYDITIARIVDVGVLGSETIVYTKPVALTEAMTKADIEFEAQPDYAQAYGSYHTRSRPDVKQSSLQSSPFRKVINDEPPAPQPGSHGPGAPAPNPGAGEPLTDEEESDDLIIATPRGYMGTVGSFRYELNYASSPDKLILEFEARKAEGDAESHEIHREQQDEFFEAVKEEYALRHEAEEMKELAAKYGEELLQASGQSELQREQQAALATLARRNDVNSANMRPGDPELEALTKKQQEVVEKYHKLIEQAEVAETKVKALQSAGALGAHLFFIAADNFDVRFRAKMQLSKMTVVNAIQINAGALQASKIDFANLSGRIDLEFVGRLGEGAQGTVSMPVADIPVLFTVPVPVYGIPFCAQFGADFLLKIFLSGKHATHHWVSHYTFGGDSGLTAGQSPAEGTGHVDGTDPVVEEKTAISPGASGLVWAVQLPKIGLGVGAFGGGALAFSDIVNVITITNAPAVAVLNPPCKRFSQQQACHVGVELTLFPSVPFVGAVMSHMFSYTHSAHVPFQRKGSKWSICDPPTREWVDPDIPMCHIK